MCCALIIRFAERLIVRSKKRRNSARSEGSTQTETPSHDGSQDPQPADPSFQSFELNQNHDEDQGQNRDTEQGGKKHADG